MNSLLGSLRFALVSLCGLGALALVLDSCGPAPTYTRTDVEDLGTGGTPVDEGTGGTGGVSTIATGGAAGSAVAGTGGVTSTGGMAAGGAGARPAGGAGGQAVGGGPAGGTPGTGGVVATGGAPGGTTGAGGAGMAGAGSGGVIATGGVSNGGTVGTGGAPATGGTSAGGATAGGGHGGITSGGGVGGTASGGLGGGFAPPAAIDCSAPSVPASGLLSDFNRQAPASGRWASSNGLLGTLFAFASDTSTATATVGNAPSDLHLTASVIANSYAGGGILFDACQSIGSFTSIRFSVSGTNNCPIWLQVQTFNLKPTTDTPEGGCTSNCLNYPTVQNVPLSPSPVTVPLSSFSPWNSTLASQVVGVYWFLNTLGASSACTTDLHFDNITLVP